MKDDMYPSHSHHKRKHIANDERESKRKHRKHRSRDIEILEKTERQQEIADVIEIHGSSSEEGEISDSGNSSEDVSNKKNRKHSRKYVEKRSYREMEPLTSIDDRRSKEPHRRCKKHHRRGHSDKKEDKKRRRAESLVFDGSSHRRGRKAREALSENVAIKQEPKEERTEEGQGSRSRIKIEREEEVEDRDRREVSRQRVPVESSVKEERSEEPRSNSNPGTSSGVRRRREEDNTEYGWGSSGGAAQEAGVKTEPSDKDKPDFKLSGKLTEDRNMFNGVVIKYSEPPESRMPKKRWRLYPFKGEQVMPTMYIHRQSAYLIGRDRKVADLPIDHPSCSKQHAALQYRLVSYNKANGLVGKAIRLYIIDLESANGTFVNNKKIESKKYVELLEKDVIKFGFSSREYVLLHEGSKGDESDDE